MSGGRVTISIEEYAALMQVSEEYRALRAASPPEIPPDEEPICECSFPLREHRVGYSRSQCKFVLRGASQPGGTPIVPSAAPSVPGAPTLYEPYHCPCECCQKRRAVR
jgi:hypothetical protein